MKGVLPPNRVKASISGPAYAMYRWSCEALTRRHWRNILLHFVSATWVNPGDDDCDSEGDTSLDTDNENQSDEEAENEVH